MLSEVFSASESQSLDSNILTPRPKFLSGRTPCCKIPDMEIHSEYFLTLITEIGNPKGMPVKDPGKE